MSDRVDDRHCDTCRCDGDPAWQIMSDVLDLYIDCGNSIEVWLGSDPESWELWGLTTGDDGRVVAHVRRYGVDDGSPMRAVDASQIAEWDHA